MEASAVADGTDRKAAPASNRYCARRRRYSKPPVESIPHRGRGIGNGDRSFLRRFGHQSGSSRRRQTLEANSGRFRKSPSHS